MNVIYLLGIIAIIVSIILLVLLLLRRRKRTEKLRNMLKEKMMEEIDDVEKYMGKIDIVKMMENRIESYDINLRRKEIFKNWKIRIGILRLLKAIEGRKAKQESLKKKYQISLAHPKLLSKRYSSQFLVQIYLPEMRYKVVHAVGLAFKGQDPAEHIQDSELKMGQVIQLRLSSPEIIFSEPVTKKLDKNVNTTNFTAKPNDGCYPGIHTVVLSISDVDTGLEYQSISFTVKVVDFAFDHISRPLLSKVFSIATGAGSLAMFVLTLLGKIDTTLGLASGTTVGILASGIHGRFLSLYQQPKVTRTS